MFNVRLLRSFYTGLYLYLISLSKYVVLIKVLYATGKKYTIFGNHSGITRISCSVMGKDAIWALKENCKMVWLNVQCPVVWYPSENLHHLYKSCILIKINSLCPSDAIWRPRCWSTLAQVIACCLTAPSHYLRQCWLIFKKSHDIHLRALS